MGNCYVIKLSHGPIEQFDSSPMPHSTTPLLHCPMLLLPILEQFQLGGKILAVEPFGNGNINRFVASGDFRTSDRCLGGSLESTIDHDGR